MATKSTTIAALTETIEAQNKRIAELEQQLARAIERIDAASRCFTNLQSKVRVLIEHRRTATH